MPVCLDVKIDFLFGYQPHVRADPIKRIVMNLKSVKIFTLLIAIFCLFSCKQTDTQVTKHQLFVFGTVVEINIWSDNFKNKQRAINEISSTFNTMHHQWHAWKPGRLTDINQALRLGKTVVLTQEEQLFIERTIELAKQSNHLFNPAMGELIHLWGFHADEYPLLTPPPTSQQIQALTNENITVENLKLKGLNLSSNHKNIWLDFGGIAKGYAIDKAVEILNRNHIDNAIINAGGDLRSIGNKGRIDNNKKPWRIAIQSPNDWSMLAEIVINNDESVFTSGNYQRYKEFDGRRYSHIINPTSGMPVDTIVSATVIAENGVIADAAATALVVAGAQWPKIAKLMKIEQVLVINEQLQCHGTAAMINRLENQHIDCIAID